MEPRVPQSFFAATFQALQMRVSSVTPGFHVSSLVEARVSFGLLKSSSVVKKAASYVSNKDASPSGPRSHNPRT